MKIAVQGCCHGELDAIYRHIHELEQKHQYRVDLLLMCGDFQAIRTHADLNCMAVPQKYLKLGEFHKYYTGQKVAPILTLVIGGNHEASNYFRELYHGGWLAPNIYYLGAAGVVRFNGMRIAGASGIYKFHDYKLGLYESVPYDRTSVRSIYHIRQFDVAKLLHIGSPDVFLSHDWPQSIENHGNTAELLRKKPFFKPDIESGSLGSPPLLELLRALRPRRWFSAHLHVKYEATFHHGLGHPPTEQDLEPSSTNPDEIQISLDDVEDEPPTNDTVAKFPPHTPQNNNPDEIILDDEQGDVVTPQLVDLPPPVVTEFLALDKCLPRRSFLEVIDIEAPESHDPPRFTFDSEWLAVTRVFHPYLSLLRSTIPLPPSEDLKQQVEASTSWVKENIGDDKNIDSVQTFVMTSPGPTEGFRGNRFPAPSWYTNPQTVAFCEMLGIENKINPPPIGD